MFLKSYQEIRIIGKGSFGSIFECYDITKSQKVALKIEDNKKSRLFWLVFLMLAPILVYLPIEKAIILYNKKSTTKTKK